MYDAVDIGWSIYTNVWYSGYWLIWQYKCMMQWILVDLAIQMYDAVDIGCSSYTNVWCSVYWLFYLYKCLVQWILVVLAI